MISRLDGHDYIAFLDVQKEVAFWRAAFIQLIRFRVIKKAFTQIGRKKASPPKATSFLKM